MLRTTFAELHLDVDARTRTWLEYKAHFTSNTPYQLSTAEYLRDLLCAVRVIPDDEFVSAAERRCSGWLCFWPSHDDEYRRLPTGCLVEVRVGRTHFDQLATTACRARAPSITIESNELRRFGETPWPIETTTEIPLDRISFNVPLGLPPAENV